MRAIRVQIYKPNHGDCSNDGISSRFNEVLIIHERGYVDIDIDNEDLPENLCKIVDRPFGTKAVEPYRKVDKGCIGWMYGGTIVDSSDARWNELSGGVPLHLHDRQETEELYDMLSR
ncbi:MAG: hypothetical protein IJ643_04055 [Eubacterium sp.]|nr:hypothetical protein [Eubacterium sp.]